MDEEELPVVGKKELLQWISKVSERSIRRFEDLKDGVALLKAFSKIWSKVVDLRRTVKWRPRPVLEWEYRMNWEALFRASETLKLPLRILDRPGISQGKFRPSYNILVLLYFLGHLAENHDFSVDFSHPIDDDLANFLQSPQSVESLAIGGAIDLDALAVSFQSEDYAGEEDTLQRTLGMHDQDVPVDREDVSREYEHPREKRSHGDWKGEDSFTEKYGADGSKGRRAVQEVDERQRKEEQKRQQQEVKVVEEEEEEEESAWSSTEQQDGAGRDTAMSTRELEGYDSIASSDSSKRPTFRRETSIATEEGIAALLTPLTARGSSQQPHSSSSSSSSYATPYTVQSVPDQTSHSSGVIPLSTTSTVGCGIQTVLTGRRLDKVFIRHVKLRRENEELRRQFKAVHGVDFVSDSLSLGTDRGSIESSGSPIGTEDDVRVSESGIVWKSSESKRKGELLLTQMRFEIHHLNQKVEHLNSSLAFEREKKEQMQRDLQVRAERQLEFQKEEFERKLETLRSKMYAEKDRLIHEHTRQMQEITTELEYQADTIRQGGFDMQDDDDIEEEIMRLRQLHVVQSREIESLGGQNESQKKHIRDVEERLRSLESRWNEMEKSFTSGIETIEKELGMSGQHGADQDQDKVEKIASTEALLRKLLETQKHLEEAKKQIDGFKLDGKIREQERLRLRSDFDNEQKIERLESEVDRLRAVNQFLRLEKNIDSDQHMDVHQLAADDDVDHEDELNITTTPSSESSGTIPRKSRYDAQGKRRDTSTSPRESVALSEGKLMAESVELSEWVPTDEIDGSQETIDLQLSSMHRLLEKSAHPQTPMLTEEFWKIVRNVKILRSRLRRSRSVILDIRSKFDELKKQASKQLSSVKDRSREWETKYRREIEKERHDHRVENIALEVERDALLKRVETLQKEKGANMIAARKLMDQVCSSEEERFKTLVTHLYKVEAQVGTWEQRGSLYDRLRGSLRTLVDLIQTIATSRDHDEVIELNQRRLDLEFQVSGLEQKLDVLNKGDTKKKGDSPAIELSRKELDDILAERDSIMKQLMDDLRRNLERMRGDMQLAKNECEKHRETASVWERKEKEERMHGQMLEEELEMSLTERANLTTRLKERDILEAEEIQTLKRRIQSLEQALEEKKLCDDSIRWQSRGHGHRYVEVEDDMHGHGKDGDRDDDHDDDHDDASDEIDVPSLEPMDQRKWEKGKEKDRKVGMSSTDAATEKKKSREADYGDADADDDDDDGQKGMTVDYSKEEEEGDVMDEHDLDVSQP